MEKKKVRTRFAPSPTGFLHIGGARTALFNVLFTLQHNGNFILRIEDTDIQRSTEEFVESILEALNWLTLNYYNDSIFYQSKRIDTYKSYAIKLLEECKAYKCYCSPEELEKIRKDQMKAKKPPKYPSICRNGRPDREKKGLPYAIRFKTPREGFTELTDIIKGQVRFSNEELEDFVLMRSDGNPTYNLCVVVDDYEMSITHVIRGDDHIVNTSKQILLYSALGLDIPKFAHVPMILGPDKQRLSKRHGTTSVQAYKETGFLPKALINYLVRLGWSYSDQEVFSFDELVEKFRLENVGKSPAVFNTQKLLWLNHVHIKSMPTNELASYLEPFLKKRNIEAKNGPDLWLKIDTLRERSKTLVEMADWMRFYYLKKIETYDENAVNKFFRPGILTIFEELTYKIDQLEHFEEVHIQAIFKDMMETRGLSLGEVAQPVRVALTGGSVSPGIFEVIAAMGKEMVLERLKDAIGFVKKL